MTDSCSTIDPHDPPPYPVVQYIERYGAHLEGRQIEALRLAGDARRD